MKLQWLDEITGNQCPFVFFTAKGMGMLSIDERLHMLELGFNTQRRPRADSDTVLCREAMKVPVCTQRKSADEELIDGHAREDVGTNHVSIDEIKEFVEHRQGNDKSHCMAVVQGMKRPHLKNSGTPHHVLDVDLAGTHIPTVCHGFTYALVGVLYLVRKRRIYTLPAE